MKKRLAKGFTQGFTLVETIIVLVLVGIAAAIAVPSVSSYISHAGDRACEKLMSGAMSEIRRAVDSRKYSCNAAASIEIYRAVNQLPAMSLRFPRTLSEADEAERAALEEGPIVYSHGTPVSVTELNVAISPLNSSVEGEIYVVGWSFSGDYVTVTMECSSHPEVSMSERLRIWRGGDISHIISPPELSELERMYAACQQLLEMTGEDGAPLFPVSESGNVGGDMQTAAELLSELFGREVSEIRSFRVSGGEPFLLHVMFADSTVLSSYNFSSLHQKDDGTQEA